MYDEVCMAVGSGGDDDFLISIVSPCYNEQEAIGPFYDELKKVLDGLAGFRHEIILVDDGSTDGTLEKLNRLAENDPTIEVYSLSRNFGHQIALTSGLDAAVGDVVIMLDSDLQHPPSLIVEMLEKWQEGNEIVSAVRKYNEDASWFKRLTSKIFYKLINFLSDTHIPEGVADFTLLSRKACDALCSMPERHRFLRGMISWIGMSRAFIQYEASSRVAGQSKYTMLKMVSLAVEAALSFSSKPLRLATRMGMIITLFGFGYLGWIILRYLLIGDLVSGWGSLICVMLILGGSQFIFIGLIGQYLACVFEEAKGRPKYILKQSPDSGK
jgi:glycosyltransferase involved in cell wall biosynthesis